MRKELRARMKALRNAIPPETRASSDALLAETVLASKAWQNAEAVFCYHSIGSEAGTQSLLCEALACGKKLYLPKSLPDGVMLPLRIRALDELRRGAYGIPEPVSDEVLADETALVLVPGLAFDLRGGRMGYGAGYYDRYLTAHPQMVRMGLLYPCQLIDAVPMEPWDAHMDFLATPGHLISLQQRGVYFNE